MDGETAGRTMTAEAAATELIRDRIFYEESGGGITLSGGEPLAQPEFAIDILRRCKAEGLHTTIDTAGFVETDVILAAAEYTDLFLYDMKHPDSNRHEKFTDLPNEPIIENLRMLCAAGHNVLVRQPIIPSFNDAPETIEQSGKLLTKCGIQQLQLLPYHALGTSKRNKLKHQIPSFDFIPPTKEQMRAIQSQLSKFPFETILDE